MELGDALEVKNMLDAAEMATRAALMRTESRGLHERADYTQQDPGRLKYIIVQKVDDEMHFTTEPVIHPYIKPPA
ncbi:hypothetical protein ACFLYL_05120 [Chloroflexota bacterium]